MNTDQAVNQREGRTRCQSMFCIESYHSMLHAEQNQGALTPLQELPKFTADKPKRFILTSIHWFFHSNQCRKTSVVSPWWNWHLHLNGYASWAYSSCTHAPWIPRYPLTMVTHWSMELWTPLYRNGAPRVVRWHSPRLRRCRFLEKLKLLRWGHDCQHQW